MAERRATVLELNAPIGHAVRVVQHRPPNQANQPTATDKIEAALNALVEDQRNGSGSSQH